MIDLYIYIGLYIAQPQSIAQTRARFFEFDGEESTGLVLLHCFCFRNIVIVCSAVWNQWLKCESYNSEKMWLNFKWLLTGSVSQASYQFFPPHAPLFISSSQPQTVVSQSSVDASTSNRIPNQNDEEEFKSSRLLGHIRYWLWTKKRTLPPSKQPNKQPNKFKGLKPLRQAFSILFDTLID
jgi:hypothetical protein